MITQKNFSYKAKAIKNLIEKLNNQTWDNHGNKLKFAYWDTAKAGNLRIFKFVFNKTGKLFDPEPATSITLYNQHLDDYKNTFNMIKDAFTR